MDASTLSEALEKLTTNDGSDESFTQLVLNGLTSSDRNTQQATVQSLHSLLTEGSGPELVARSEAIFAEHALDYLPAFFAVPTSSAPEGLQLALICTEYCSAREAILALGEACSGIEESFFGCVVSDDEDVDDNEMEGDLRDEVDDTDEVQRLVPVQMKVLFQALSASFGRMPNTKSTPTLLVLADTLESALIHLSSTCAGTGDNSIAQAAMQMIVRAWEWVQRSKDAGGEQRAILSQLFFLCISLFSPQAHDSLKRWFSAKYPKYAQIRTQPALTADAGIEGAQSAEHPLSAAMHTATVLKLDTQTLIDNIGGTSMTSRVSPHASFASLILLAHSLAESASPADASRTTSNAISAMRRPDLADTLTLLGAALGSTAVDAGLTYLWELVSRMQVGGLEADAAEQLIETLFPIAATHPDPLIRMAVWKLVCEMVHKVLAAESKVRLTTQLLEPENPFVQIRLQALVLLRQELSDAARQDTAQPTILSPLIWSLPLTSPLTELDSEDLFGSHTTLITEQLVLLRFISELDEANRTGIQDPVKRAELRQTQVEPAREVLARLKRASAGQSQHVHGETGGAVGDVLHGLGEAFVVERLEGVSDELEMALQQ